MLGTKNLIWGDKKRERYRHKIDQEFRKNNKKNKFAFTLRNQRKVWTHIISQQHSKS